MSEPVFTAKNGAVFRRGFYITPETAEGVLRGLEADARNRSDWFHKPAAILAAELRQAMAEAYPYEEVA